MSNDVEEYEIVGSDDEYGQRNIVNSVGGRICANSIDTFETLRVLDRDH